MAYKSAASAADTQGKAGRDRRMRLFIVIVGSLVILAMTYGSGMRAQVRRIRDIEEKRKAIDQELRQSQRNGRLRLAAVEQLEARRQVSLALMALDQRNFGIAQKNVTEAARLLDVAQKADTTNPDLSGVATSLHQMSIVAAADISAQRNALLSTATQMDKTFDAYTPQFLQTSAADDDIHPIQKPTMNDVPNPNGHEMNQAD